MRIRGGWLRWVWTALAVACLGGCTLRPVEEADASFSTVGVGEGAAGAGGGAGAGGEATQTPTGAGGGVGIAGGSGGPAGGAGHTGGVGSPLDGAPPDAAADRSSLDVLDDGAFCLIGAACKSGVCIDGVCCDGPCAGGCFTCAAAGAFGTCRPRAAGASPRAEGQCGPDSPATCGRNGSCDGTGQCAFYPVDTVCGAAGCASPTSFRTAAVCDGAGHCGEPELLSCAPYVCRGSSCNTTCTTSSDCASPSECMNGACGDHRGGACSVDADCASGHCSHGVCCNTACNDRCRSCALPSSIGVCTPLPGGCPDPADAAAGG